MKTHARILPPAVRAARRTRGWRMLAVAGCCCFLGAWQGPGGAALSAADLKVDNVYAQPPKFLASLQRIALLPVAASSQAGDLPEGCAAMNPVVLDELVHLKKFEVVAVRPQDLEFSTGRLGWTGSEKLPAHFFDDLQRRYGCDAVLFCQLTEFKAYAPLAIGWRLKLVDVRTKAILWAADQVFDNHQIAPSQKTSFFKKISAKLTHDDEQDWVESVSPQAFGHQTISAMLKTLPER